MDGLLRNRAWLALYAAQVLSLVGTGVATVALALIAHRLVGAGAGGLMGLILVVKMIAYVGVTPLAVRWTERMDRKRLMVGLDLFRAAIMAVLPFVTRTWEIVALIFLMQAATAAFVPVFNATIADLVPEPRAYTRALGLSRLAYEVESFASPMLAGLAVAFVAPQGLFWATVAGFAASAVLILGARVPRGGRPGPRRSPWRGIRMFLDTPRLRGLMAIDLAIACAGAVIFVQTVVFVQTRLGLTERDTAMALTLFGVGSAGGAILGPLLLRWRGDRPVLLGAGAALAGLTAMQVAVADLRALLVLWAAIGLAYSTALLPAGRLIRRSAASEDRTVLFAAHFTLSHAAWLLGYGLVGLIGSRVGLDAMSLSMAALGLGATVAAALLWPAGRVEAHEHDDLPEDHPHLAEGERLGPRRHAHAIPRNPRHS